MNDTPTTITDRLTQAAVTRQSQVFAFRRELRDLMDLADRYGMGEVIVVEDGLDPTDEPGTSTGVRTGSFVVEISQYAGDEHLWQAVHAGRADRRLFLTADMALLHLIALRAGGGEDGRAASYAARVMGLPDSGDRIF